MGLRRSDAKATPEYDQVEVSTREQRDKVRADMLAVSRAHHADDRDARVCATMGVIRYGLADLIAPAFGDHDGALRMAERLAEIALDKDMLNANVVLLMGEAMAEADARGLIREFPEDDGVAPTGDGATDRG